MKNFFQPNGNFISLESFWDPTGNIKTGFINTIKHLGDRNYFIHERFNFRPRYFDGRNINDKTPDSVKNLLLNPTAKHILESLMGVITRRGRDGVMIYDKFLDDLER